MPINALCQKLAYGLAVTVLGSGAAVAAPVTPAAPAAENAVADFTLANGLEVVVIPDHRAPIVTQMVWYKIGSADEPPGKSGIAHFFEHLMFKGTAKHKAGEFSAAVAAVGGTENAFTSYDYTAFFQTVPPAALPQMMDFEADRMRGLVLSEDVIGAERDVVLEERRMRIDGSPQSLLQEETQATLYQNHPYRIPVIGWEQEMEQLNRADAVDFYNRYYAPNNAVLVVGGDVEPDAVRTMAEATFGNVARGPDLPARVRPSEPEQNTARTVTMRDARVNLPSYSESWVVPSYRTAKPGEAEALALLGEILGGGIRSRIYQNVVVKGGIGAGAGAGYDGSGYDPGSFSLYGVPQGTHTLAEVQAAVDKEVQGLLEGGVTADELSAAKTRFVRAMIFARDQQSAMANLYGRELAIGMTVKDVQEWPDRIEGVTAAQILEVAKKYLNPDIAVTSYLLPKTDTAGAAQ